MSAGLKVKGMNSMYKGKEGADLIILDVVMGSSFAEKKNKKTFNGIKKILKRLM